MAAKNHDVLILGGVAGAGFLAWEFLYKPWKAAHAAGGSPASLFPYVPTAGGGMVSAPTVLTPAPGGTQGSIVDARVTPGGDVGAAMWKKGWTEIQAKTRLDAIKQGVTNGNAAVAQLKAGGANPAAQGIPGAQAAAASLIAAISNETARMNQDKAAGDTIGAGNWAAHIQSMQQDLNEINARIASAQLPVNNAADIAKWEGQIAALKSDYTALTGMTL